MRTVAKTGNTAALDQPTLPESVGSKVVWVFPKGDSLCGLVLETSQEDFRGRGCSGVRRHVEAGRYCPGARAEGRGAHAAVAAASGEAPAGRIVEEPRANSQRRERQLHTPARSTERIGSTETPLPALRSPPPPHPQELEVGEGGGSER